MITVKNISRVVLIFYLVVIITTQSYSQTSNDDSTQVSPLKSLTDVVIDDICHVATAPLRISSDDAIKLLVFATVNTAIIYGVDQPTDESFSNEEGKPFWRPAEQLADIGDFYDRVGPGKTMTGLTAAIFAGGLIFDDNKLLETSRLIVESSAITIFLTYIGKGLFGRSRPFTERGAKDFHFFKFSNNTQYRSLPSGHASGIFAVMTVIAKKYDQWYIKYPAYTFAVGVCLQRMDDRKHWFSDVIVGGALGYWVSSTLVNHNKKRENSFSIEPFFKDNRFGLSFNF